MKEKMKKILIYFLVGFSLKFSLDVLYLDKALADLKKKLSNNQTELEKREKILVEKISYYDKYKDEKVFAEYKKKLEEKNIALKVKLTKEKKFNDNLTNKGVTTTLEIRHRVQSIAKKAKIHLPSLHFNFSLDDPKKTGKTYIKIGFTDHISKIWDFFEKILFKREDFVFKISNVDLNLQNSGKFIYAINIEGYL